jgi:hypothetical protein
MGKVLLVIFGLSMIGAAISLLAKGILLLAAFVIGLMLLLWLYRASPMAFYAFVFTTAIALVPKAIWPWVGLVIIAWLTLELVVAIYARVRRPLVLRLPAKGIDQSGLQ